MDEFHDKSAAMKEMEPEGEAHIEASCAIAFLEGSRNFLLDGISTSDNLTGLEIRLRRMEASDKLPTPAPSQTATQEDLAWRICRLQAKWLAARPMMTFAQVTTFNKLLPNDLDISVEAIEKVILDVYTRMKGAGKFVLPLGAKLDTLQVALDDNKRLDILRQHLFWLLGKKESRRVVPYTRRGVYILAVELSMNVEASNGPSRAGAAFPVPPPTWRSVGRPAGQKVCCGCCSCHCHPKKAGIIPAKPRRRTTGFFGRLRKKGASKLGWMRSLLCWRKARKYDDSDSSSASSVTWHD